MSIYLDNAATVPLVEPAINALTAQMRKVGNASSLHSDGRAIRKDVEDARLALSQVIDCEASEIIFTGSGTEADNLAVKGFFWKAVSADPGKNIILTSPFEHHAIKDPIEWLVEHDGAKVVEIPVGEGGVVNLEFVQDFIKSNHDSIALITVMHSNNEIGTLQPIAEIVNFAGEIPVHTDAVKSRFQFCQTWSNCCNHQRPQDWSSTGNWCANSEARNRSHTGPAWWRTGARNSQWNSKCPCDCGLCRSCAVCRQVPR